LRWRGENSHRQERDAVREDPIAEGKSETLQDEGQSEAYPNTYHIMSAPDPRD
jgi:hypothetical protein